MVDVAQTITGAALLVFGAFGLLLLLSIAVVDVYHDRLEERRENRLRELAEDLDVRETRRHLEVIADALAAPGNRQIELWFDAPCARRGNYPPADWCERDDSGLAA